MIGRTPSTLLLLSLSFSAFGQEPPRSSSEPQFPVTPKVFIDDFTAAEGLTFNGQGELYIGANNAIWKVETDGSVTKLTDVITHLGQAGIGPRDILAADFGPTVALRHGPSTDGIIWRLRPEGTKTVAVRGIGDPNCILGLADGSYLVSDDFTNNIYRVDPEGTVRLFSDAVKHPNGLVLSPDGSTLYVAQIFTGLAPIGFADQLWAIPLEGGKPAGEARVVARTGEGGLDGLAMDELGRVYIADNGGGKIWRYDPHGDDPQSDDPQSDDLVLIAEGVKSAASLVFGEGELDHEALYVTSGFRGGGTIWKIPVGVRGVQQHRVDAWANGHDPAATFDRPTPVLLSLSGDFNTRDTVRQGLVALHHFNFEDARALFQQAQEKDPTFALAYWGEAMSHYDWLSGQTDLDAGREAMARLDAQSGAALASLTAAERALLDAARQLFADGPRKAQESLFAERLALARKSLPHEAEISVFYGLALQGLARHGNDTVQRWRVESAAVLEDVLAQSPRHPGALHYLVHAYDHASLSPLSIRPARDYEALLIESSKDDHEHATTHAKHPWLRQFIEPPEGR